VKSATGGRFAPERREEVAAVAVAQVQVEEHGVDAACSKQLLRLADPGRLEHPVAVELEVHTAEQAERLVVVDHQDCLAGSAPHGSRSLDG
jgi:hypothetical protein